MLPTAAGWWHVRSQGRSASLGDGGAHTDGRRASSAGLLLSCWRVGFQVLGRIRFKKSCLARKTKTTRSNAAHFNTKVPPWATGMAGVAPLASPVLPLGLVGFGCFAPEQALACTWTHTRSGVTSGGAEATGVCQYVCHQGDALSYSKDLVGAPQRVRACSRSHPPRGDKDIWGCILSTL